MKNGILFRVPFFYLCCVKYVLYLINSCYAVIILIALKRLNFGSADFQFITASGALPVDVLFTDFTARNGKTNPIIMPSVPLLLPPPPLLSEQKKTVTAVVAAIVHTSANYKKILFIQLIIICFSADSLCRDFYLFI
jgi:hypothetical protein